VVKRRDHRRRRFELLAKPSVLVGSGGECSAQRLDLGVATKLFAGRLAGTTDRCVPLPQNAFRGVDGGASDLGFASEIRGLVPQLPGWSFGPHLPAADVGAEHLAPGDLISIAGRWRQPPSGRARPAAELRRTGRYSFQSSAKLSPVNNCGPIDCIAAPGSAREQSSGNTARVPPTSSRSAMSRPAAASPLAKDAMSARLGSPSGWNPWPNRTKRPRSSKPVLEPTTRSRTVRKTGFRRHRCR
jgi:hypothetical protein